MVSSSELQISYNHLYSEMRNYIWNVDTVISLAELEQEVYTTFPDTSKLKVKFEEVRKATALQCKEDEDLKSSIEEFADLLSKCSTWYAKLASTVDSNNINS